MKQLTLFDDIPTTTAKRVPRGGPNGAGLYEIRAGQFIKSWDSFKFYKIKLKGVQK